MPATDLENTLATNPANDPTALKKCGLLVRLWALTLQGKRFCLWLGIASVVTAAMGSAANHFFSGGRRDPEAAVEGSGGGHSSKGGFVHGMWWSPESAPADGSDSGSRSSSGGPASFSSGSTSIIPIDRGAQFSAASLTLTAPAPIVSDSSSAAYAVLGLGTSSSPALSPSSATGSGNSELHFSLAGDLNLVPADNLAAGGLSLNLAAVPEPSISGMLALVFAGLALTRRRKLLSAA